ncbi:MAG: hypothetical protein HQ402_00275 [Parcubacteria group bacterium]|nr:hypothetical protein [Parcubacteria group bacterium]
MTRKYKVYIGCSLTYATPEFRQAVEDFKDTLRTFCQVLDFMGIEKKPGRTAEDIYLHDIKHCVGKADLMVAICDQPSTGLGYEMATQIEMRGKPVLAVAQTDSLVSDLILGINGTNFEFRRYGNLTEVTAWVKKALESIALQAA